MLRISWGHMDGVSAEKGPPGVGECPSATNPNPSESSKQMPVLSPSSSSDIAVSTLSWKQLLVGFYSIKAFQ